MTKPQTTEVQPQTQTSSKAEAYTPAQKIEKKFAQLQPSPFPYLVAAFTSFLLVSNVCATKLIDAGWWITDGGAFLFPLTYVLGDVMSEVYGFYRVREAVAVSFLMQLVAALCFLAVSSAQGFPEFQPGFQESFDAVLGFYPRIVFASIIAFAVGQLLNSWTMVLIKMKTKNDENLWWRLIASTLVGELADSLLFCTIAFGGVVPGDELIQYIYQGYVYKCLVEVVVMPATYVAVNGIKKLEPTYDSVTDEKPVAAVDASA